MCDSTSDTGDRAQSAVFGRSCVCKGHKGHIWQTVLLVGYSEDSSVCRCDIPVCIWIYCQGGPQRSWCKCSEGGAVQCSDRYNYNDSAHSVLSDICRCSDSVSVHEQRRTSGRYDIRRVCKTGLLPAALCSGCKCVYGADI